MSAEQIYNLLESESESETDQDSGKAGGEDEPEGEESKDETSPGGNSNELSAPVTEGGIGQVLDAPPPDEETPTIEEQAREWDVAVNQATTVARQAGKVPAGLHRTLEGAAEASVDWREMLRRLWSDTIPADYSWMRPNRRHVWAGLYLPGVMREGVEEIAIAVDCSGSVNRRQLRLFEPRCVRFSKASGLSVCMSCTLTPRSTRSRHTKPANRSTLTRWEAEEPNLAHASIGSMSAGFCRRPSSF
jgi:hypothetical protein